MSGTGSLVLYTTEDGRAQIQLRAVDGTVWLTQAEIAALFDTTVQNANLHLKNIVDEGELDQADDFDELLARIRDIRASEKRFYQKVRDLFAATSVDYDKGSGTAKTFFATIQNKLVYAATTHTAAELVVAGQTRMPRTWP